MTEAADTARAVSSLLRRAFRTKFSVTSSGWGGNIRVQWTDDGPELKQRHSASRLCRGRDDLGRRARSACRQQRQEYEARRRESEAINAAGKAKFAAQTPNQ